MKAGKCLKTHYVIKKGTTLQLQWQHSSMKNTIHTQNSTVVLSQAIKV